MIGSDQVMGIGQDPVLYALFDRYVGIVASNLQVLTGEASQLSLAMRAQEPSGLIETLLRHAAVKTQRDRQPEADPGATGSGWRGTKVIVVCLIWWVRIRTVTARAQTS